MLTMAVLYASGKIDNVLPSMMLSASLLPLLYISGRMASSHRFISDPDFDESLFRFWL